MGFSLAHEFNETVAMDLKQFRGVYILHMVDNATRYNARAIISSKQKEIIIDKIINTGQRYLEHLIFFFPKMEENLTMSCLERWASN